MCVRASQTRTRFSIRITEIFVIHVVNYITFKFHYRVVVRRRLPFAVPHSPHPRRPPSSSSSTTSRYVTTLPPPCKRAGGSTRRGRSAGRSRGPAPASAFAHRRQSASSCGQFFRVARVGSRQPIGACRFLF